MLAVSGHCRSRQRRADDREVFACTTQRHVKSHAVPALGDLWPGDAEAQSKRPPVVTHRGWRRSSRSSPVSGPDLHDRQEPTSIVDVRAASQASTVGPSGSGTPGCPDDRKAGAFRQTCWSQPQLSMRIRSDDVAGG